MKFYEVIAKCGHVGREYYYEGHFFVRAQSKQEAATVVKKAPRVKKDHEDVILDVFEVDKPTYLQGLEDFKNNPYFNCNSKWEQKRVFELIKDGIKPETETQLRYRERRIKYYKDKCGATAKPSKWRGIRNPYKYAKYNLYLETAAI